MRDPEVRFTRLGKLNVVRAGMEEAAVAVAIIADLRETIGDEDHNLLDIFFHVATVGGQDYFVSPGDGCLQADACEHEDAGMLDAGPFAGKRLIMPGPATEPDDDPLEHLSDDMEASKEPQ